MKLSELEPIMRDMLDRARLNLVTDKELATACMILTATTIVPVLLRFRNAEEKSAAKRMLDNIFADLADIEAAIFITDSWQTDMSGEELTRYLKDPIGVKNMPRAMEAIAITGVTKEGSIGASIPYRRVGDAIIFDSDEVEFVETSTEWLAGAFPKGGTA